MPKSLICSKCNGAMIEGFVPSPLTDTEKSPITWVEGEPDKQFSPIKESAMRFPITTYCCRKCGFLEFYAR